MNREKLIKGIKLGLTIIADIGISALCSALAGNIASTSRVGSIQKACMAVGGIVIGGMVSQQAEKYIDAQVDNLVTKYDEVKAVIDEASDNAQGATT